MLRTSSKKSIQNNVKYKELFDLSNFPASSKYCCSDNKKVVGKMKDEYGGKSILKFVGETKRAQIKVTMPL